LNSLLCFGYPDGSKSLYEEFETTKDSYQNSGFELAEVMIKKGAKELLKEAEQIAFKDFRPERL